MENKNNNNNFQQNAPDMSLAFKEHREFFLKFYEMRTKFTVLLSESFFKQESLIQSYQTLFVLIEWTSNYIDKTMGLDEIDEEMGAIEKLIKSKKTHEAIKKLKTLNRSLSPSFEKSELLPKTIDAYEDENAKFWKDEDHKAMKEMKKAFYDVLMVE